MKLFHVIIFWSRTMQKIVINKSSFVMALISRFVTGNTTRLMEEKARSTKLSKEPTAFVATMSRPFPGFILGDRFSKLWTFLENFLWSASWRFVRLEGVVKLRS